MAIVLQAVDIDVPNAEGDLYAAPASTTAVVRGGFVNTSAGAVDLTIYRKASGGSSFQLHETLTLDAGKEWIMPKPVFLEALGAVRGVASVAASIKATLNVVEKA